MVYESAVRFHKRPLLPNAVADRPACQLNQQTRTPVGARLLVFLFGTVGLCFVFDSLVRLGGKTGADRLKNLHQQDK